MELKEDREQPFSLFFWWSRKERCALCGGWQLQFDVQRLHAHRHTRMVQAIFVLSG